MLATVVKGNSNDPFSIATTPFPGLFHSTLDPYLITLVFCHFSSTPARTKYMLNSAQATSLNSAYHTNPSWMSIIDLSFNDFEFISVRFSYDMTARVKILFSRKQCPLLKSESYFLKFNQSFVIEISFNFIWAFRNFK